MFVVPAGWTHPGSRSITPLVAVALLGLVSGCHEVVEAEYDSGPTVQAPSFAMASHQCYLLVGSPPVEVRVRAYCFDARFLSGKLGAE